MSSSHISELDSTAFPCPEKRPSPECRFVSCAVPATGNPLGLVQGNCGSAMQMERDKKNTGGVTGRGVTPCPFGYIQTCSAANKCMMNPYKGKVFDRLAPVAGFQNRSLHRPKYVPPSLQPRSMVRIGNEWKTGGGKC